MTRNEYEQAQRRLEESRRAGVEMVETAYQAQMRSLEMVWNLLGVPGDPSSPPRGPSRPPPKRESCPRRPLRRSAGGGRRAR